MDTHVCILFDISLSSLPIVLPHIVIKLKMWEGNCKRSQSQKNFISVDHGSVVYLGSVQACCL